MPVRSIANQYRGVNAHLHSVLQGQRGWNNFHNPHIIYLNDAMRALLLPLGYTTVIEESLQIRRASDYARDWRADSLIYDVEPDQRPPEPRRPQLSGVVKALPAVVENPISETPYRAIAISRRDAQDTPVAWVEVLSPSNKRGGDRATYLTKRDDLLDAGLTLVEIDYLHETPSTLYSHPDYTSGDADSHPYRIVVFDPHPDYQVGRVSINEFDVDEPIPSVIIPLSGVDTITLDFDAVYQHHFRTTLFGIDNLFDYADLPPNFDRYRPDDQARIARRMLAVLQASQRGDDLDAGAPFPVDAALTLTDALTRLNQLKVT